MKSLGTLAYEARNGAAEAARLFAWGLQILEGTLAAPGTLVVVGGRTGAGKSMFGLKLLEAVGVHGLFVSLEDPLEVVGMRARHFDADGLDRVYACRPARPRVTHVGQAIHAAFDQGLNPKLVVVDYAQLLMTDQREANRTEELAEIIAELKGLATELGFVCVLNSQLRRPAPERILDFPTIWELRDSASLENCAETVVLLGERGPARVEARLAKNKIGPRGSTQFFARGHGGWLTPEPANGHGGSVDDFDVAAGWS